MKKGFYTLLYLWLIILPLTGLAQSADEGSVTPRVQLAKVYDKSSTVDVSEYLVSEKFDGVRAIWTGAEFVTRNGNPIKPPRWFSRVLPQVWLDGELWTKHNDFAALSGIVRTANPADSAWQRVTFRIFDMPDQTNPFSIRYKNYQQLVRAINKPHIIGVEQHQFLSNQALTAFFERITKRGGEGVMLHLASAKHQSGRSSALLKLKPYFDDEATVIAHHPGKGKYHGMLGALKVKNNAGVTFKIGTGFSDKQRRDPPAIGALITYRYHGYTKNGLPRFASFLRERPQE
ncbi:MULTISPECIES: DNA ligase [unclassified Pseudoalteromonas]|uniref:DNA ligase n=1 Tax=unclassified Pseudoalteromonas TaxID=194690 RepID=UPI000C07681E|nr:MULTISPECIES: DNA ligase [unclassified Pseudoalteromonas]MDP2635276.1 DNA ligase [Pseudoalteromonas sp. 1_MG-2023]PHN90904.1 DNA ligase [Pseudoalteromonas sp. 3D05]